MPSHTKRKSAPINGVRHVAARYAKVGARPYGKLEKIAALHEEKARHHEQKARILRAAIAMLDEHASASSVARAAATLKGAMTLDAARRRAEPNPRSNSKEVALKRRTATATFLSHFDAETPREGGAGRGVGTLIRHGYLKKKGDGYIRTAKVYEP